MWLIISILALGVAAGGACAPSDDHRAPSAEPIAVRVVTLEREGLSVVHEVVGTLRAENTTDIAAEILGRVDAVHVEAGDVVRAGELLVALDDRELAAAVRRGEAARAELDYAIREAEQGLAAARADVELAAVTHQRYLQLMQKRSVSAQEYDEVSARLRSAEAAVEMAEARRRQAESRRERVDAELDAARVMAGYARVVAPTAGMVTARHVAPGSLATPGTPLVTLEQAGALELNISVPASLLGLIEHGQSVRVGVDGIGVHESAALVGRVTEIVRAVDPSTRTAAVTIELPADDRMRSGLFGRAELPGPPRDSVTVPAEAVVQRGRVQSVFVVENDVARRRIVSLGREVDGRTEVLSGLEPGDRVVLDPAAVSDNQSVVPQGR